MVDTLHNFIHKYVNTFNMPEIRVIDVIEIFIIAFIIYFILKWIRNTKAWMLLKGLIAIFIFLFFAYLFKMNTILWIAKNSINVIVIAMIIVFQPELRRGLEKIGETNKIKNFIAKNDASIDVKLEHTINEVVDACFDMAKVKTGALIVLEKKIHLPEYEGTGIRIDAEVTKELLLNIFEHNTPLHDGAVMIRNNRIVAATCYLKLSENKSLDKSLGTRHRAAVGLSENSDAIILVVSEETGHISIAMSGILKQNVTRQDLYSYLLNNSL